MMLLSRPSLVLLFVILVLTGWTDIASAAVRVEVEGIRGASLRRNVERSISLSAYQDRAISPAQARRLFERAPEEIRLAMQPFGYYRPEITSDLTPDGDGWIARFTIRVRISAKVQELTIDLGQDDTSLPEDTRKQLRELARDVRAAFPLQPPEDRLVHSQYERGKAAAQAMIEGRGYLSARNTDSRVDVHVDKDAANIHLRWHTGPRYRMGEVRFEGAQFPDAFMQRFVQFPPGSVYDSDELLRMQRRLIDAEYFGFVSVAPDLEAAQGDVVPIVAQVAPASRTAYMGGVSVGTDSGFGLRGSVKRRWVNQRGHKANAEVELSQRLTAAALNYEIFWPGESLRSLNIGATHRREETDSSESETTSVFAMENRLWLGWMRDLGLRALYGDFTIAGDRGNSTLLFAEGRLSRRQADDDLFPTSGYSLRLEARAGAKALLSDTDFVQLRAEARYIRPLGESQRQRLHLRGIVGTTWVDDFNALPPPLRFFAGGDRTIRGYGYQALGPMRECRPGEACPTNFTVDRVIGGKHLAVLGAEYERDIVRNWSVAGFVDTGNAFTDTSAFETRTGVGVGVRWRSPVGLVRVDIARGLDHPQRTLEFHIMIGPDL